MVGTGVLEFVYELVYEEELALLFPLLQIELKSAKLGVPETPPDPSKIPEELMKLHYIIGARYLGMASLIEMKMPSEGFSYQNKLLKFVRTGYQGDFYLKPMKHVS